MGNKERKAKSEVSFGIVLGIDIIAISWILLLIPALLVQAMGIEHNSSTYMVIMSIFQLVAGFLATLLSIKTSLKSAYLANNNVSKAIVTGIVSVSILAIINYLAGNLLPIIPFNNLIGLIILIIDYIISHYIFKKMY